MRRDVLRHTVSLPVPVLCERMQGEPTCLIGHELFGLLTCLNLLDQMILGDGIPSSGIRVWIVDGGVTDNGVTLSVIFQVAEVPDLPAISLPICTRALPTFSFSPATTTTTPIPAPTKSALAPLKTLTKVSRHLDQIGEAFGDLRGVILAAPVPLCL